MTYLFTDYAVGKFSLRLYSPTNNTISGYPQKKITFSKRIMRWTTQQSNPLERAGGRVGGRGEMHITGNVGLREGGGLIRGKRREGRNGNVYRSTSAPLTSTHSSRTSPLGLQSIISYSQLPNRILIAISTTKPDLRRCVFPVSK